MTPKRGPRVITNRRPRRWPRVKLARSPSAAAIQATRIITGRLTSPCAATTPPRTMAVSPGASRPMNAPVSANASAATSAYVHVPRVSERSVSAPSRSGIATRPTRRRRARRRRATPVPSSATRARRDMPVATTVAGRVAGRRFMRRPHRGGDLARAQRDRTARRPALGRRRRGHVERLGCVLGAPARGRPAQAAEGGEADRRRQPDRDRAVGEDGGQASAGSTSKASRTPTIPPLTAPGIGIVFATWPTK